MDIVDKLLKAKQAYYSGNPTMSDAEFDALEDQLRSIDPNNSYFNVVGTTNNKLKIKHKIPMLSAAKAKTIEDVEKWIDKIGCQGEVFQVEPKVDGLSCTIKYKNGKLVHIATRGDGLNGQDISHIQNWVKLPKTINDLSEIEVRGELFIPKNSCPNPENKPLRSMAAGFINRKDDGLSDLKYVKFVAYEVVGKQFSKETDKLKWIEANHFNVIDYQFTFSAKSKLEQIYDSYLSKFRDKWEYETDGLMIILNDINQHAALDQRWDSGHHHQYNLAWKPPAEAKETKLIDIEWNVSRQGKLVPIALIEPIVLGGARISRCTLNNYEYIVGFKLHKGDTVLIQRANDVIPYFQENLTKHASHEKSLIPSQCPSCQSNLQVKGVHLVCINANCREQVILKIVHWVVNCEMEFVSESTIRTLFDNGKISSIRDLYSLTEKDLMDLSGFGDKKCANILLQIASTKEMTMGEFVDRLGIDLVGVKAMKKLNINNPVQLFNFTDDTYVIGQNIIEYVKQNKNFIVELLSVVKIREEKKVNNSPNAKTVCMTGTGHKKRNDLIADIKAKGDIFSDSVDKTTNILVCEDPAANSSKLQKARKLGIKLMSYAEYFKNNT